MAQKNSLDSILLTGGHAATTALATIESLKERKRWDIAWVGSERAVEGSKALTLEFREFPKLGIKCYNVVAGRVQRKFTRYSIWSLIKIPFGFLHAFYLLLKIRPKVIISFGGFAAFPVVFGGWLLRIPIIVHEQTIAIGMANKYSVPFATKIALSRQASRMYFPEKKSVLIGNPVRSEFFSIKPKNKIGEPPLILATGGSRGSKVFNKYLLESLDALLNDYTIIHQSGELDYDECKKVRDTLPSKKKERYGLFASIAPEKMYKLFEKADIIIGRAGANTVAEVIASGRPAIFMPIPWSQHDEQTKNAILAANSGQAQIIKQNEASADLFIKVIKSVRKNWNKMADSRDQEIYALDKKAADRLATLALEVIK